MHIPELSDFVLKVNKLEKFTVQLWEIINKLQRKQRKMTQLNVGIVGTGIFARDRHLPSYQELSDNFKVVAVFNRHKAKALNFAEIADVPENKVYDNVVEILNDSNVDFIDALLPVQFNVDIVEKAVRAADSTPIPIGVAENWLYLPCVKTAKEQIKKIAPVLAFTHNSTGPFVADSKYLATTWRQKPEHIGGVLSDGGVHQLALVTSLLGELGSVSALTRQVREISGADDIVFATVQLKDTDVIGSFTYGSAFGATEKSTFLKVYGKNGTVTIDLSDKRNPVVKVKLGSSAEDEGDEQIFKVDNDESFGVNGEFLNFHEAVSKKDKSLYLGAESSFPSFSMCRCIFEVFCQER
ncbi:BDM_1a_G0052820.mRNA.1.CDS.1 [Saccharomyces cerevisiae]|nr:BDM_1a_G0052820.mRNA.1.CDS.1 [Saccharomyces cerevisiae]CAI7365187.1 BDM_1a_G0052820.mRNA.1.CDS.1 [Saccharomyces cerevisiae]